MRIEQLRYLDAVITCGSMRRAGEVLHLSQPALSESIRNLERELGVTLLERRRSGAKISAAGRELLPYLSEVLDAVERLRAAAGDQERAVRTLRIGTVQAATVPVVAPAIRDFRDRHPDAQVEVRTAQQAEIREALLDGSLDLGLINVMAGEWSPEAGNPAAPVADLDAGERAGSVAADVALDQVEILRGEAVVCCRTDSPLAALPVIGLDDLVTEPIVFMRPGYVMHHFVRRALGTRHAAVSYSADGAEMGKTMVAEGLGVTVLPDYSVAGDPLERGGVITLRPLAVTGGEVVLVLQARRSRHRGGLLRELESALRQRAGLVAEAAAGTIAVPAVPAAGGAEGLRLA